MDMLRVRLPMNWSILNDFVFKDALKLLIFLIRRNRGFLLVKIIRGKNWSLECDVIFL
jgi:hypothetical protein